MIARTPGSWPLFRIDEDGHPHDFGRLMILERGSRLISAQRTAWLRGEFADGLFPGVPWFLDHQRPGGFLGRQFARRLSRDLGMLSDPDLWSDDAVFAALLHRGEDGSGDFLMGERGLEATSASEPEFVPASCRSSRYEELASAVLRDEFVGSWVGGEQPKFTTAVEDDSLRHVIVKFSEPVDSSLAARRWADLLICEHLANELIAEYEGASAQTRLVWSSQGRMCLEVTRFDRVGTHGRRGCVTLAAWSDAHDGERDDWPSATLRMQRDGWLGEVDQERVRQRWWFGRMIANTDMHFGNLSFFLDKSLPFRPTPSYDMLPMLYRPASTGEVVVHQFQPPVPTLVDLPSWRTAAAWAEVYWQRVSDHADISDDFRQIAVANHDAVCRARVRVAAARLSP